ncbi:NepR family anti-sigma factor [Methylobacterium sp. P31]
MIGDEDQQVIAASAGTADTAAPVPRPVRQRHATARSVDQAGRDRIGRGLRLHYAEILALPIPDRLRSLLNDLAACSDTEAQR